MEQNLSFLKPDFKKVIPEVWQDVIKSTVVAGLGTLGVLLVKQVPVVGGVLRKVYFLPLYGWILLFCAGLLIGFWVASAVVRTRLKDLTQLADTDDLTGLGNLRKQKVSLNEAIRATASSRQALSIIYTDIDNFKSVNDVAGHDSGDFVLKQFAEILNQNRKVTDIVCRRGGDEFLVIAPKTPGPGALIYANRLRNEVASTPFKTLNQKPDVLLTISAGVAEFDLAANEASDVFVKRAESAMQRAKEKRNQVEVA